jgi:MFS family permease
MNEIDDTWDYKYEWKAIVLLALGFGLLGLDRFAINPLFPAIMKDLNLDYQDLGNLSSILAVTWGFSSMVMGGVSDRLGRRRVLIPAVVLFSALAGFTGLANGITGLLLLRAMMGLSEGAFVPASIAATIEASKPSRRGLNFGIQQNGLPILGLGLGPIIATQLLLATNSWRWVFAVVSIPGFIVAFFLYRVLRDTQGTARTSETDYPGTSARTWRDVLRYRNIIIAVLVMICMSGALNVIISMTPNYLSDFLGINLQKMGFIVSATGFGAILGGTLLPALSDRCGRKPIMLACISLAALAVWLFTKTSANSSQLFLLLFCISGLGFSVIYINIGPLTIESVPPALASTAVGIVAGAGEIIGGGIAPSMAGYIAKNHGIQFVFALALGALLVGSCLVLGLRETNPRRH